MEVEIRTIFADEGKVFRRIHDGLVLDNKLDLGYDFSINGQKRLDLPEYYEQIDEPELFNPELEMRNPKSEI